MHPCNEVVMVACHKTCVETMYVQILRRHDTTSSDNAYSKREDGHKTRGKTMKIITTKDINAAITAEMLSYINQGYRISMNTMGGTQGAVARVDLTNGNETIRITLDHGYDYGSWDCEDSGEYLELTVSKYDCPEDKDTILWDDRGETISSHRWFVIECNDGKYAACEWEDGMEVKSLRHARRAHRHMTHDGVISVARALPSIRKHAGYKRTKASDVTSITKEHGHYYAHFGNLPSKGANRTLRLA